MSDSKPQASLSSGLLARKGGAKPAMRRQGINFPDMEQDHSAGADAHEDLGWNDMGYDVDPDHHAAEGNVAPVSENFHHNPLAGAIPEAVPAVKKQQEEIAAKLGSKVEAPSDRKTGKDASASPPPPLSISREVAPLTKHSAVVEAARKAKKKAKVPAPAKKSRTRKAKAAFTLRLDADRHLKLRLATAVKNVSAQQLVTKAVDEYLRTIPELDDLANRIPARGNA